MVKISGYLSIYNDWDILEPALRSVLPMLDELIVVDGGYRWMAPFLEQVGKNPARSQPQVYDILNRLGIPVKIYAGLWDNEISKRLAGYRACSGRYVLRVDADEILHFDKAALDGFFASGQAIAEMEMPTYVVPGWIEGEPGLLPKQSFIFDRAQISAEEHLHYLWLVLTVDQLPPLARRLPVFHDPVAFNAHLTMWRTPQTAIQRACFYVLNWHRQHGFGGTPNQRDKPLGDISALFDHYPAKHYFESMMFSGLVSGHLSEPPKALRKTPLNRADDSALEPLYRQFLQSHADLNADLHHRPRHCFAGQPIYCDISCPESRNAIFAGGEARFEVSSQPHTVRAVLHNVIAQSPWQEVETLNSSIVANQLKIQWPAQTAALPLRQVLEINFWCHDQNPIQTIKLI